MTSAARRGPARRSQPLGSGRLGRPREGGGGGWGGYAARGPGALTVEFPADALDVVVVQEESLQAREEREPFELQHVVVREVDAVELVLRHPEVLDGLDLVPCRAASGSAREPPPVSPPAGEEEEVPGPASGTEPWAPSPAGVGRRTRMPLQARHREPPGGPGRPGRRPAGPPAGSPAGHRPRLREACAGAAGWDAHAGRGRGGRGGGRAGRGRGAHRGGRARTPRSSCGPGASGAPGPPSDARRGGPPKTFFGRFFGREVVRAGLAAVRLEGGSP